MAFPVELTQHDIKPNDSYLLYYKRLSTEIKMAFPVDWTQHDDTKPNYSHLLYYN